MIVAALCLSMAIYYEARSEPELGQEAVADVVMNVAHWNKKQVCRTVFKPYFLSSLTGGRKVPHRKNKAWITAQNIAKKVINRGEKGDITQGSNHFFVQGFHPWWEYATTPTINIGHHHFCKELIDKE